MQQNMDKIISTLEVCTFGGIEQLEDIACWATDQQGTWWKEKGPRIHTPQLGDIACAYLICVGVCGMWQLEDAIALLESDIEIPELHQTGHTKSYWKEKIYRLLGVSCVIVSNKTDLTDKEKQGILRDMINDAGIQSVEFIEHQCHGGEFESVILGEEEEKVRPENLQ